MITKSVTKQQLSNFSGLSILEIGKRCNELSIFRTVLTKSKNLIYDFSHENIGRILLYDSIKLPEKVLIKEIYHIYESKINTQKNE